MDVTVSCPLQTSRKSEILFLVYYGMNNSQTLAEQGDCEGFTRSNFFPRRCECPFGPISYNLNRYSKPRHRQSPRASHSEISATMHACFEDSILICRRTPLVGGLADIVADRGASILVVDASLNGAVAVL